MRKTVVVLFFLAAVVSPVTAQENAQVLKNVDIYKETDRFAGWPANNGIWNWGDEIVVGFTLGYYKDKGGGHPIDPHDLIESDSPTVTMCRATRDDLIPERNELRARVQRLTGQLAMVEGDCERWVERVKTLEARQREIERIAGGVRRELD